MNPQFEYFHFTCDREELQDLLTTAGLDGWRLHTCDPIVTSGEHGTGLVYAFVVLDRVIIPGEEEPEDEEPVPDAMMAKG